MGNLIWVLTLKRQVVSGIIQMITILVIHDLNSNGA